MRQLLDKILLILGVGTVAAILITIGVSVADQLLPNSVQVVASGYGISVNQQSVTASAAVPTTQEVNQIGITIKNTDADTNLWCGDAATVSTTNGYLLKPGEDFPFETNEVIRCVSNDATAVVVSYALRLGLKN